MHVVQNDHVGHQLIVLNHLPLLIRRIGNDSGHHFFGYYNKTVWDRSGRYVLANRMPVMDINPTWDMTAEVGYFDAPCDECRRSPAPAASLPEVAVRHSRWFRG